MTGNEVTGEEAVGALGVSVGKLVDPEVFPHMRNVQELALEMQRLAVEMTRLQFRPWHLLAWHRANKAYKVVMTAWEVEKKLHEELGT